MGNVAVSHEAAAATVGRTKPGRKYIDKQMWWWTEGVQMVIKVKKQAFKT